MANGGVLLPLGDAVGGDLHERSAPFMPAYEISVEDRIWDVALNNDG